MTRTTRYRINAILALLIGGSLCGTIFADEVTVIDNLRVTYSEEGKVVLLAMPDADGVLLELGGSVTAEEAGSQPVFAASGVAVTATSGVLQYTLYGYAQGTKFKITVRTETVGYIADRLQAAVTVITETGSDTDYASGDPTLGTIAAAALYDSGKYVPLSSTAKTIIEHIDGVDTWTDIGEYDGAEIIYKLVGDPNVTSIEVIYTLMGES